MIEEQAVAHDHSSVDRLVSTVQVYEELLAGKNDEIYELRVHLADAACLLSELVDDYRKAERFNPQLIREGQPKEIWDRAVAFYITATGSDGSWGEYQAWNEGKDELR